MSRKAATDVPVGRRRGRDDRLRAGRLTAAVGLAATGGLGLVVVGPLLGAAAVSGVSGGSIGAMLTRGFESEIAEDYDQAMRKGQ